MSLIDRSFLLEMCPKIEIQTMKMEMKLRGLGSQRNDASQFVVLDFYLPSTNGILAQFSRKIHIVDKLEARVLMGMDIILRKSRAFVVVSGRKCDKLSLPKHDMMFKPLRQNCFTAFAHLVSGECKAIVVENPTDKEVIVTQNLKLRNIMDSDAQIMTATVVN
ncbi:hypothetical protein HI914_01856 [Erysiphe necator]|nr:hypothetical protein HI914_01856 [Erysiphe necator]